MSRRRRSRSWDQTASDRPTEPRKRADVAGTMCMRSNYDLLNFLFSLKLPQAHRHMGTFGRTPPLRSAATIITRFDDMFRPFEPSLTRFKSLVLFTAGRSGAS